MSEGASGSSEAKRKSGMRPMSDRCRSGKESYLRESGRSRIPSSGSCVPWKTTFATTSEERSSEVADFILTAINGAAAIYAASRDPAILEKTIRQLRFHLNCLK